LTIIRDNNQKCRGISRKIRFVLHVYWSRTCSHSPQDLPLNFSCLKLRGRGGEERRAGTCKAVFAWVILYSRIAPNTVKTYFFQAKLGVGRVKQRKINRTLVLKGTVRKNESSTERKITDNKKTFIRRRLMMEKAESNRKFT
jgi:hypothetical protein